MYHFTFGQGSPLRNHYVTVVEEDYDEAREGMVACFGPKWSFQYDDNAIEEIKSRWGTKLIFKIVRNPFNGQWEISDAPRRV